MANRKEGLDYFCLFFLFFSLPPLSARGERGDQRSDVWGELIRHKSCTKEGQKNNNPEIVPPHSAL
jgi:hypothetical protein